MPEAARLEIAGLVVTFVRQGDRFGHAIALVDKSGEQRLLESIEGSPDELWPASPPLQELHVEERAPGERLALLIGMAGRGHWSASVAVESSAQRIVFDVACRTRDVPERLGTSYRLLGGERVDADNASAGSLRVSTAAGAIRVELLAIDTSEASADRSILLNHDTASVAISPIEAPRKLPTTIRWRYAISRADVD